MTGWRRWAVVGAFAVLGAANAAGFVRVEGFVDDQCHDSQMNRAAARDLARLYATPLTVAPDADPALRAQVAQRNRQFAAQRSAFLVQYPPIDC